MGISTSGDDDDEKKKVVAAGDGLKRMKCGKDVVVVLFCCFVVSFHLFFPHNSVTRSCRRARRRSGCPRGSPGRPR